MRKLTMYMSIEQMHEELNKIGFVFESQMETSTSNPIEACEALIAMMGDIGVSSENVVQI